MIPNIGGGQSGRSWWEWLLTQPGGIGKDVGQPQMGPGMGAMDQQQRGQVQNNMMTGTSQPNPQAWWQNQARMPQGGGRGMGGPAPDPRNAQGPRFSGQPGAQPPQQPQAAPSSLGVSGGVGPPIPPGANAGGGGQGGGAGGPTQQTVSPGMLASRKTLDPILGQGWSDHFASQNGVDPLTFYIKPFANDPRARDLEWLEGKARDAAINDARFQRGGVAEWQKVHGNVDIPQEQWDTWWKMAQSNNGQPSYGGAGINPWGVY